MAQQRIPTFLILWLFGQDELFSLHLRPVYLDERQIGLNSRVNERMLFSEARTGHSIQTKGLIYISTRQSFIKARPIWSSG
jgi:hypothetical protein